MCRRIPAFIAARVLALGVLANHERCTSSDVADEQHIEDRDAGDDAEAGDEANAATAAWRCAAPSSNLVFRSRPVIP
jgi:hypothetical protein